MSRAAAMDSRKSEQKAAIAIKNAEKDKDKAMGLTSTFAKIIKDDELLCTSCGATRLGPPSKCECAGGRSKPGSDYCPKLQLLTAAKARFGENKAAEMKASAKNQETVAAGRSKKREGAGAEVDAEYQGDDDELSVVVQFPVGKLGMSIEKNVVSAVTGAPAAELGVQRGWVLRSVAGEPALPDKAAVSKLIMRAFKDAPAAGLVDFRFRCPIVDGLSHCSACDKFVATDEFDEGQLESGPGKQMCSVCEEVSGMGYDA